ncbi:cytochrome b561 and DOMON domain-containing protein At4g12980-like [Zingiber officinale]|uniref:Cytochrome b561 and DOMON domain-containing protein n=1 Tax=Zingiber officinale TaxID=94328 RepID=A0A8J5KRJ1_ZINOF|nr:cytochrome b561 and DOMON domain-containing protein At4g12980-like [Zingiber officinale]KAG6497018.1 hypothetical protein ZIOFF_044903 [Zingiber officinale]
MAARAALLILLAVLLFSGVVRGNAAGSCSSMSFPSNRVYAACSDLPRLSSSLHWTYEGGKGFGSLSFAFVAPPPSQSGWVSWAINPSGGGMIGCQALIAFRQPYGAMGVKTYNVTGYGPVSEGPIAYETSDLVAEFTGGAMRMFGKMKLPEGTTVVKQVWQVGAEVVDGVPQKHDFKPENLESMGTVDLLSGGISGAGSSASRNKNTHGILCAVSWGVLLPLGQIFARYLKTFKSADPAWFYLHISCQTLGYVIGVAGWATGLVLGNKSKGIVHTNHRNIGITLFTFCTLQVFALFLRPNKDHKYRLYWNIYHHSIGYSVIILSIVNIFKGMDILAVEQKWRTGYIVAICILGGVALILEIITWTIVLKRKSGKPKERPTFHV